MGDCHQVVVPQVGAEAPVFSGKAVVGSNIVDLSYEKGTLKMGKETISGKYTILFFYPLDFTFVCPTEIIAFSDRIAEFAKVRLHGECVRVLARAPAAASPHAARRPTPSMRSWAPRWRPCPLTPSFRTWRGRSSRGPRAAWARWPSRSSPT